jgi:hypothetical protein
MRKMLINLNPGEVTHSEPSRIKIGEITPHPVLRRKPGGSKDKPEEDSQPKRPPSAD